VTADPLSGVEEMVQELVTLGHREVAGIFGPSNTSTGMNRETCIREQLGAAGLTIQPGRALHGPFDFGTGYDGTKKLLSAHSQPTAIICGNDVVALGALNAAAELGVTVPGDVSIVGFDDLPTADWALVKLSTIAFDLDKMSREAAQLLVERVEGRSDAAYRHVVYPTRFRPRNTLGRAPVKRRP
jgi:LacI family transcriptional regulator